MLQGPLSRFGDTASNAVVISLLDSNLATRDLPIVAQTLVGSVAAACWRLVLMPLDMCKTLSQVRGGERGMAELGERLRALGPSYLWGGSSAAFLSTVCGHLPWYTTFNFLNRHVPTVAQPWERSLRHGVIGFTASVVSDCCTNSLRVVKAIKQAEGVSYSDAARAVLKEDGLPGLFGRGLKTRIMANGFQGLVFTAVWKRLEEHFEVAMFGESPLGGDTEKT
jgi:hypothetical protein